MYFFSPVTTNVLLVARARSRDDNYVLMRDRVTIVRTVSAAGTKTGTRHQQRKQQRRRQASIRSRHCSGGCAGGKMCRIPPSRETLRRRIEFEDATDMRLPEAARCQVGLISFTYPIGDIRREFL